MRIEEIFIHRQEEETRNKKEARGDQRERSSGHDHLA